MDIFSDISELPLFDTLNVTKKEKEKSKSGNRNNDAYKYIETQIEKIEKLIIEQCHFCKDHRDNEYKIENIEQKIKNNNKRTINDENKKLLFVQTLEDYLNHLEFVIMEEMLIIRNENVKSPYNHYTEEQWNILSERVDYLKKITGKLSKSLKFKIEHNTHINKKKTDVLFSGFPAGTVTGAPKIRAIQIIEELEKNRRNVYAGSVGYISADGNIDTCIALRTAVIKDKYIYIQSGAGIVADSKPISEFKETENKALALLTACEQAKNFK